MSFLGLDGGNIFKAKKLRGQRINSGVFEGRGSALALKCLMPGGRMVVE